MRFVLLRVSERRWHDRPVIGDCHEHHRQRCQRPPRYARCGYSLDERRSRHFMHQRRATVRSFQCRGPDHGRGRYRHSVPLGRADGLDVIVPLWLPTQDNVVAYWRAYPKKMFSLISLHLLAGVQYFTWQLYIYNTLLGSYNTYLI